MLKLWRRLKTGEKILFAVVALFALVAIENFAALEWYRRSSNKPMYPVRTHYDFAGDGFRGSEVFRKSNCTLCHKAVGNGTNMGLNLDGIGSRRDLAYLEAFLRDPEATYGSRTVDHGPAPKEAAYVADLPQADLHAIAVFLSQLRADRGAPAAQEPPKEKSGFIDAMLDMWAPDSWRASRTDVRDAADAKPGK
jgi:cytochrome c553